MIIYIRILLGSENVKCPTPRAEIRLRCGEVALIPLQLQCKVILTNNNNNNNTTTSNNDNNNDNNDIILVTLTLIFPKTGYPNDVPLDVIIAYQHCNTNDINNDNDTNNDDCNDDILNILKEFCKQRIDNDTNTYPRSRAVLEKMKLLLHNKYFHHHHHENTSNDNDNDNDNDININNTDSNDIDMNTYATCMVCRCHIFNMIDIEEHDPR